MELGLYEIRMKGLLLFRKRHHSCPWAGITAQTRVGLFLGEKGKQNFDPIQPL